MWIGEAACEDPRGRWEGARLGRASVRKVVDGGSDGVASEGGEVGTAALVATAQTLVDRLLRELQRCAC